MKVTPYNLNITLRINPGQTLTQFTKIFLAFICCGIVLSVTANDQTLSENGFAGWNVSSPWKIDSKKEALINYNGKLQYRKLLKNLKLDAKFCYKLTVEYRFKKTSGDTGLFGQLGTTIFNLPNINDWGKAVIFYHPKTTGEYKLYLSASGTTPFEAKIRTVKIAEIPAGDLKKVIFCFDDEPGPCPIRFYKDQRWLRGGDNEAGIIELVEANDHALSGKAIKITKKGPLKGYDRLRAMCANLPFSAGNKYRLSGWFKADRSGLAQVQLTSPWEKGKQHWYKFENFRVSQEWTKNTFTFDIPAAKENSTLQSGVLYISFGLFINSLNELYAKDITWEML